nr:MAG TPA: hypothetical protein [Caudoviricetes sp.]
MGMNSTLNNCGRSDCCESCGSCGSRNSCDSCGSCSKPQLDCEKTSRIFNPFNKEANQKETCTSISIDEDGSKLNYKSECGTQSILGKTIGNIIQLNNLKNVKAENPDAGSMLVFNPRCKTDCPCEPDDLTWQSYHIPDAGDCVLEAENGFYKILVKDGCGLIKECRIPVAPKDGISLTYHRDSVPDDPDFPWYYGAYNDKINLHLRENAKKFFGNFDLKVTIHYGIQVVKSDLCPNTNFRSLVVPVVEGQSVNVSEESSILQGESISSTSKPEIPWGTVSMRGSFTFIVPKGKEAYLHHEFRLRSNASFPNYLKNPTYDGKRCPDSEAAQTNKVRYTVSRLNALQVLIEPTLSTPNFNPVKDEYRNQLDPAVDSYTGV